MTDNHRQIRLNSLWLLLGRGGGQALMLLFTIFVARFLGEAGLGQYAFMAAVVFVGNVLTTFGMDTLLIREIAQAEQSKTAPLAEALAIQLGLSGLFILVIFVIAGWLPNQSAQTAVSLRWLTLSLIPLAFTTAFSAALRAFERMDLLLLVNLGTAVMQTGGTFILLKMGGELVQIVWLLVAVQGLMAVVAGLLCHVYLPDFVISWGRLNWTRVQETAVMGASLAFLMVLAVIYQRMGIFVLSLFESDEATGWFSVAARLVEAAKMLPYAVYGALFPMMARGKRNTELRRDDTEIHREKRREGERFPIIVQAFSGSLFYAMVTAGGLAIIASWLIPWLFGDGYAASIPVLPILAWSLPPFVVTLHYSFTLVARRQERVVLWVTVWVLGLTAVFTFIGTKMAGLTGTAWAIVAGETVQGILLWQKVKRGKLQGARDF